MENMTTEEKLTHFLEASIERATRQSTQIIDDYKKALDKLFEEHKTDSQRKADLQLRLGRDILERDMNKELSREQIQIKRDMAKKQDSLKEQLFQEVQELLEKYMASPDYKKLLLKQIKAASSFAGTDAIIIYINPSDADKLPELEQSAKIPLTISQASFIGGIRAVIESKNILIDNSFETQLKEAKESFTFFNK